MLGFTKKRFFVTLGLSVAVWLITAIFQAFGTFGKYVSMFSSGCQVTGYPVDVCMIEGPNIPPIVVIIVNILFWFWGIHFFWSFFKGRSEVR